jgi:hypothetical protein
MIKIRNKHRLYIILFGFLEYRMGVKLYDHELMNSNRLLQKCRKNMYIKSKVIEFFLKTYAT